MTYARSHDREAGRACPAPVRAAAPTKLAGSSRTPTAPANPAGGAMRREATTHRHSTASSMYDSRSAGSAGSSGRYAHPARSAARKARIAESGGASTPTMLPGLAESRMRRASSSAAATRSAYVISTSASTRATARGFSRAERATGSWRRTFSPGVRGPLTGPRRRSRGARRPSRPAAGRSRRRSARCCSGCPRRGGRRRRRPRSSACSAPSGAASG